MKNTKRRRKDRHKLFRVLAWLSLIAAVAVLLVGEMFISRYPGGSFFAVVTRLVALAFLMYTLFCALYRKLPRFSRVCRAIWHSCAALMAGAFIVIEILIASGDHSDYPAYESAPSSYMIVLGAGLKGSTPSLQLAARLDEAAGQLLARPEMIAVVSGGQGLDEDIPEAQAMYEYLVAKGVDGERILKEDQSVNTAQNMVYSMEILKTLDMFDPDGGVIVCSNGYHLFRARKLLERGGITPYALDAAVPRLYLKLTGYLREFFSVLFMWRGA